MGDRFLNICLVTGVLLCVGVWIALDRFGETIFRSPGLESEWPDVESIASVGHLNIDCQSTHIGLLKQDGRWIMTAPFSAAVDQSVVKRFLDAVSTTQPYDRMSSTEMKRRGISIESLGLENPSVAVSMEGGGRRFKFSLGTFSQYGDRVYVMEHGTGIVGVYPARLSDATPRSVDAVRSRSIIEHAPESIGVIEVRSPGAPFVHMEKRAGGWVFTEPIKEPADSARVEAALMAVHTNRIERFLWPTGVGNVMDTIDSESAFQARLPGWGLSGDATVSVKVRPGNAERAVSIVFGSELPGNPAYVYALFPDGESVGAVPAMLKDLFKGDCTQWRDCRLFPESSGDVKTVKIEHPGESLKLARSEDGLWRIVSPSTDFADQAAVEKFVAMTMAMKSQSAEAGKTVHSEAVACKVEIGFKDHERRFSIFKSSKPDLFVMRVDESGECFDVAADMVPDGFKSFSGLLALYDKTMLSLPANDIKRLTRIVQGSEPEVALRSLAGVWLCGGDDVTAGVSPLIELLASLKSVSVSKPVFTLDDLDACGLRVPSLEIIIDVDAADAVRRHLHIGNPDGAGRRYAVIGGCEALFLIDEKDVSQLEKPWK